MVVKIRLRGFTLVELLVVVAIVLSLIAMLLPVLNTARLKSQQVVCMSNLRQFTTAFRGYLDDNSGYFMHFNADPIGMWWGRRLIYYKYVPPSARYFLCPSNSEEMRTLPYYEYPPYIDIYTGYALGDVYYQCEDRFTTPPSELVILVDSCRFYLAAGGAGGEAGKGWSNAKTYRHNGGVNCLYHDGHIEWHIADELSPSENMLPWEPYYY